jgi:hypothetical protein
LRFPNPSQWVPYSDGTSRIVPHPALIGPTRKSREGPIVECKNHRMRSDPFAGREFSIDPAGDVVVIPSLGLELGPLPDCP